MKTTEISKDLIGKRCECIFTGMMVTGVIEDTEENEYSVNVKVPFLRSRSCPRLLRCLSVSRLSFRLFPSPLSLSFPSGRR